MRFSTADDLHTAQMRAYEAQRKVEAAALQSIHATHFTDDRHAAAAAQYAAEQIALAARDLVRAVEALPADNRPLGRDAEVASWTCPQCATSAVKVTSTTTAQCSPGRDAVLLRLSATAVPARPNGIGGFGAHSTRRGWTEPAARSRNCRRR